MRRFWFALQVVRLFMPTTFRSAWTMYPHMASGDCLDITYRLHVER